MKAAVLHDFGELPRYEDFPDPIPEKGEILVRVKAVTLENIDQMLARGEHYASHDLFSELPMIVGKAGVGETADGTLVGFSGMKAPYGAMAEKVVVPEQSAGPIPDGVRPAIAAALPSSAMTSLFPLKWGMKMKQGENVLINGATGVSGKLAVQIAKHLGAGRVIGTGRNEQSLERIKELGADATIDLKQPEEEVLASFKKEVQQGIDIVLDFVWGRPTEMLLKAIVPEELSIVEKGIRLVQIGEKAGPEINLPARALRTSGLEISGGAKGMTPEWIQAGIDLIWEWVKDDKLQMDIEEVPLNEIGTIWQRSDFEGNRVVIIP